MLESRTHSKRTLGSLIFLSRWLQAPLYLGLIKRRQVGNKLLLWQVIIHALFLLSAVALAAIDRMTFQSPAKTQ